MSAWVHVPREPDTATLRVGGSDRTPWPKDVPRCVHATSDGACPRPARPGSDACTFHDLGEPTDA